MAHPKRKNLGPNVHILGKFNFGVENVTKAAFLTDELLMFQTDDIEEEDPFVLEFRNKARRHICTGIKSLRQTIRIYDINQVCNEYKINPKLVPKPLHVISFSFDTTDLDDLKYIGRDNYLKVLQFEGRVPDSNFVKLLTPT